MKPLLAHALMLQFPVVDGELQAGHTSLSTLAAQTGTPFYVYDSAIVRNTLSLLRATLPDGIGIHYALKANPYTRLVNFIAAQVDGFDVASIRELDIALSAGMSPAAISIAGPGKNDALLRHAIEAGIRINVESISELQRIARLAQGVSPPLSLRINPDFEMKSAGMRMGGGASPFGIDAEQAPAALAEAARLGLNVDGLHFYPGSQILRADVIVAMQEHCFDLALHLAATNAMSLRSLNLGGGFGIPYCAGESRLDLTPIASCLTELSARAATQWPGISMHLELGRYLVGEAGLYVTRVIERKTSRGKTFLITDGGMNHHLAASGNLGQVLRKNYPLAVANRMDEPTREIVSIAGPLCTPLDLLADNASLPPAEAGDLIVVYQSGAYGYSASPRDFLSHPAPAEILL